jgi:AAA15 family ATPase/GTPase
LELRLDFSFAEGKAPNGFKSLVVMPFLDAGDGQRFVSCAAFFGANAAGKSNILKAFLTLKLLLKNGTALAEVFEPNLLNPKAILLLVRTNAINRKKDYNLRMNLIVTYILRTGLSKICMLHQTNLVK